MKITCPNCHREIPAADLNVEKDIAGGNLWHQIYHHQFNLPISLFGIPFLLGTVVLGSFTLMTVFGR